MDRINNIIDDIMPKDLVLIDLEQDKSYELELELYPNSTPSYIDNDNWKQTHLLEIKKAIELVFINLSNYPNITSRKEMSDVIYIYKELIKNQKIT